MLTDNVFGADNQQERLETIGWVVGFTDGEGCFSISFVRSQTSSTGWQIFPEYVVTQGESSLNALKKLKKFFSCGNIFVNNRYDNHRENLYRFCIRSFQDLNEKVIPFFKEHPLQTKKQEQFEHFVQVLKLMGKKSHLNLKGIRKIALIASQMNTKKTRPFLESSETIR